ncbi:flavin reductase family protein [Microbacterium sp. K41]|uniref:flavin reductase family protein n=1 Tax=Microbacterium sp. K41 TaxID=2305437 RepID=UPI00109C8AD9|nr:flavin reductase family protein [Microbacterium sp. K41]
MRTTRSVDLPVLYFGTPVALITTVNPDGSSNISPISSAWALGSRYLLGLGSEGQAAANIERLGDLVINLPSADLVYAVEAIAPTTGRSPVPAEKVPAYRHERDKWGLGNFSPVPSDTVVPPRIAECPVQIEARVAQVVPIDDGNALAVEAEVLRVHVHEEILKTHGPDRIDTEKWNPLSYAFRHYFAQGPHVGSNFRAPLLDEPVVVS